MPMPVSSPPKKDRGGASPLLSGFGHDDPDWNRPPGGTFSPMMYRIQFLDDALRIKAEWRIVAPDVAAAIALAKAAHWPARAVRMQILDDAGRMVHERLKADDR
jgi:hypothetical protein